jgi:tetratricopeptide (TPR) repeat protein
MSDPRKPPSDVPGNEWDKLLDDLDQKVDKALEPSAAPPKAAAPPRPAAPAPPPPRPPAITAPAYDHDDESERTVIGVIPRELMAQSVRGGAGGLSQLLKRGGAAEAEEKPDALVDSLLDKADAEPDDDLVTSAPVVRKPPPAPPRPPAKTAPAPTEVAARRVDEQPATVPPPPDDAPAMAAAPVTLPPPAPVDDTPAPSTPAPVSVPPPRDRTPSFTAEEPPSSQGPKLLEPEDRMYAEDEQTMVAARPRVSPPRAEAPTVDAEPPRATSLAPPPLPPPPVAAWPDERDAAAHLADAGLSDDWRTRAEWLEAEARAASDKPMRARMLLAVSEILAMVGDDDRADELATEARDLAPQSPFAHRQARAKAARERAFADLVPALEAEGRVAPTPSARVHAALLAAEIARVVTSDPESVAKRLELAIRAVPGDPRAHVQKLATELATPEKAPKYRWPDAPSLQPLVDASAYLAALRGAPDKGPPRSPLDALVRVRAAFGVGDTLAAAESLAALRDVRDVGRGALWVAAALAAPSAAGRARAVEWLRDLKSGAHPDLAARSLASRALESADVEAAKAALDSGRVFSAAERAALGALLGLATDEISADVKAMAEDEALSPLASAVDAFVSRGASAPAAGSVEVRAQAALGRSLGRGEVASAIESFAVAAPDAPLSRVLRLEDDLASGRAVAVASGIAAWPRDGGGAEADRDRGLASSLALEAAGETERAKEAAVAALSSDPASEASARVVAALEPDAASGLLAQLAEHVEDPTRRAALLLEAAVRGGEGEGYADLLSRAHDAAPDLPFAAALGTRSGRRAGDVEALLKWIRTRRDSISDPIEKALDLVREAMLVADADLELAVQNLETACAARPEDVALRDLLERLSPAAGEGRAGALAARAETASAGSKARLALTAALELERTGDLEGAARLAGVAVDAGGGELARLVRDRCDMFGPGAARLAEELMTAAREATEPAAEREAFERLAYVDEIGRGDTASGLLWHRSILEKEPSALPSLRRLEHALTGEGREDELEPIFVEIAKATGGGESTSHAQVAARLRQRTSTWDATRDLVTLAASAPRPGLWALRQLAAHSVAANDDDALLTAVNALGARTDRPIEQATLMLRAAEATLRKGDAAAAIPLLRQVLEQAPSHPVAHATLADALENTGDLRAAAEQLEGAANVSEVEAHQIDLRYRAALLWLDKVGDRERGVRALETVADVDILYLDAFPRLSSAFAEMGERAKLATLLERRLDREDDPARRVELEVTRGRALADVGDIEAAKSALAAALEGSPDHVDALLAFADLCGREGDWDGAEQSMIRLARLVADPAKQAEIYLQLGVIYRDHLPNPDRAELSYREVLRRVPDSVEARERLVAIHAEQKDAEKALAVQGELLAAAKDPETKRQRTIELARLQEGVVGDVRKAEQTLEALRKESPNDSHVLRALAEFHVRHNHGPAVNVLLDRTAADARRALNTGRFEVHFFANLATVFELRGNADAAATAHATLAALEGTPSDIAGTGLRAARPDLDELLAPEIFTPPFRELLRQAGSALEGAVPADLKTLRAAPFPMSAGAVGQQIVEMASAFGFQSPQLFVSSTLGPVCLPISSSPATLVFGQALIAEPSPALPFLTMRALKILQAHVGGLARTAPIDLWPLTAAFLLTFAPSWSPQGVDIGKLADFRQRVQRALPPGLGPELGALALEVIGSLGNRASTLQTAANAWGARCALLASGDVKGALDAIALGGGQSHGVPATGPDRIKWIGRNGEARDLVVFAVSNEYAEARKRAR